VSGADRTIPSNLPASGATMALPMRTKPPRTVSQHVALRLDDAVIARIDAFIPLLSTDWHKATRSEVLRAAILRGLDLFDRDPEGAKRDLAQIHPKETPPS
jgi:hypothetical protein